MSNTRLFNIALPKALVEEIDKLAKKEYRNRSELIREALLVYLRNSERWEELLSYGKKAGKRARIKSEEEMSEIVDEYRHGEKRD